MARLRKRTWNEPDGVIRLGQDYIRKMWVLQQREVLKIHGSRIRGPCTVEVYYVGGDFDRLYVIHTPDSEPNGNGHGSS